MEKRIVFLGLLVFIFVAPWSFNDLGSAPFPFFEELFAFIIPQAEAQTFKDVPKIEWGTSMEAVSYEIEISKDKEFKNIIMFKTTKKNRTDWDILEPGIFYWRVRGVDKEGHTGEFSETATVEVSILSQEMKTTVPEKEIAHPNESPAPSPIGISFPKPPTIIPVTNANSEIAKEWQWSKKHYDFWFGMGINYFSFSQTIPSLSNVNSSVIAAPSYYLLGDFQFSDKWGVEASYKNSPGALISGGNLTVQSSTYSWQTINLEGSYLLDSQVFGNKKTEAWLRAGVQENYLPFLALNNASVFSIHTVQMTTALLGAQIDFNQSDRVRYELLFHYQYPFASGGTGADSFSVQPQYAFDGSLGIVYRLTATWRLGLYLYGQINQYNYSFTNGSTSLSTTGSQTLFYSNGELRLGYEF